jgi:hypothetical protein
MTTFANCYRLSVVCVCLYVPDFTFVTFRPIKRLQMGYKRIKRLQSKVTLRV